MAERRDSVRPLRQMAEHPSLEARLARALQDAGPLPPLGSARAVAIRRRIQDRLKRKRQVPRAWIVASAIAALLLMTRLGWAQVGQVARALERIVGHLAGEVTYGGVHTPGSQSAGIARAPEAAPTAELPDVPLLANLPAAASVSAPLQKTGTPHKVRSPARPALSSSAPAAVPTVAVPSGSDLADEAEALQEVIRLRDDPRAAQGAMQSYRRRFPRGALAAEADVVELRTDLAAGDSPGALSLLERMDINGVSAPGERRELQVLYGEMLARAGRCGAALDLFRVARNDDSGSPDLSERAMFGDASCLLRLGRLQESKDAFAGYLAKYPNGRFRPEADEGLRRAGNR